MSDERVTFLARLVVGRKRKLVVLALWLLIALALGPVAGRFESVQRNEPASFLPGDSESVAVLEASDGFPSGEVTAAIAVFRDQAGLGADARAAVELARTRVTEAEIEGVGSVSPVVRSTDGTSAVFTVPIEARGDADVLVGAVDDVRGIVHEGLPSALEARVTGPAGFSADATKAFEGINSTLLFATAGLVFLLLVLIYRSPIFWALPLLTVVVAESVVRGIGTLLAEAGVVINGQTGGILLVLVFGAGTDYALLLTARYREELLRVEDTYEAMRIALRNGAPAIAASAGTVVVALLCLSFARVNSTAGLGPVLAVGIIAALAVMTTLLPALLVICGRWVFWPKRPGFGSPEPTATGFWARVGTRVSRRPRSVWVGTAAALAVACLGVLTLDANGLSSEDSYTKEFDSIVGQKVLTAHGLSDQSAPLMIVANSDKAADVAQALSGVPGLGEPSQPAIKDGVAFIAAPLDSDASSPASFTAVKQARSAVHAVPGSDALVGGATAFLLDVEKASSRDNLVIIPIVLLVVLLVLMVLLRAVTAPLILVATVVLSFGAALGISSLLFKYVFGFAGADASFPLFVFVFLVALGIDYNIFLMTRVREETPQHGTRKASLIALSATGGVITSAGLVLAATFAVLGSLPLVFLTELGVAVALGVLLDTIIVRSILVTAINLDVGPKIWWPSHIDRGTPAEPTKDVELEAAR